MEIQKKLSKFPPCEREWENYELDQLINDRGIMLDMAFVKNAIYCDQDYKEKILTKAKELTKIENPNPTYQLKKWLENQNIYVPSLTKSSVEELLKESSEPTK